MSDERRSFGDLIYELRQKKGWTLREAANRSGLSFGRLGEIERGIDAHSGKSFVPSYMSVIRLARAFGVPPAELLREAGHEPGIELEPEEWDLIGIFRSLPPEKRQDLLRLALGLSSRS